MKKTTLPLTILVLLLASGCELMSFRDPSDLSNNVEDVIVFQYIEEITLATDAVHIERAELEGNILKLKVSYGGNGENEFRLYGWLGWDKTNPPGGHLYLSHDAKEEYCEALQHEELVFNLRPLESAWEENFQYSGPVRIGIREPGETRAAVTVTAEFR